MPPEVLYHVGVVVRFYAPQRHYLRSLIWCLRAQAAQAGDTRLTFFLVPTEPHTNLLLLELQKGTVRCGCKKFNHACVLVDSFM